MRQLCVPHLATQEALVDLGEDACRQAKEAHQRANHGASLLGRKVKGVCVECSNVAAAAHEAKSATQQQGVSAHTQVAKNMGCVTGLAYVKPEPWPMRKPKMPTMAYDT